MPKRLLTLCTSGAIFGCSLDRTNCPAKAFAEALNSWLTYELVYLIPILLFLNSSVCFIKALPYLFTVSGSRAMPEKIGKEHIMFNHVRKNNLK